MVKCMLPVNPKSKYKVFRDLDVHKTVAGLKNAIDITASEGTVVRAARDGTVQLVKDDSNRNFKEDAPKVVEYTNIIIINHDDGTSAMYAHLKKDSAEVKVGDKVFAGQTIAQVGNTGYSTEPHLHFQVTRIQTIPIEFKEE